MPHIDDLHGFEIEDLLRDPVQWTVDVAKRDIAFINRKLARARKRVAKLEAELAEAIEHEKRVAAAHEQFKPGDAVPDVLIPKDAWLDQIAKNVERYERLWHSQTMDTSKIEAARKLAGSLGNQILLMVDGSSAREESMATTNT